VSVSPKDAIVVLSATDTFDTSRHAYRSLPADASGRGRRGFRLREARNKVLTLHAIPNIRFRYELRLPREQPHPAVGALGHDAVSVVLDLVNPFRTGGWAVRWTGEAGLDEVSRMGQGTFTQHAVAPRRNLFDGH
jgi:hypothetical protein